MDCSRRIIWIVMLLAGLVACATSRAQIWEYTGQIRPVYDVSNIVHVVEDPRILLAAGTAAYGFPEYGGVFRSTIGDTLWQQVALTGYSIDKIAQFDNYRGYIFAATSEGVFTSTDIGATWRPFPTRPLDDLFSAFAIFPRDSLSWIVAMGNNVDWGLFYRTADGGTTWHQWTSFDGVAFYITPSRFADGIFYFGSLGFLYRGSFPDSAVRVIRRTQRGSLRDIVLHQSRPWIYAVWEDTVGRYDEVSGTLELRPKPAEVLRMTSGIADGWGGLWIGTTDGIYHVNENLADWQRMESPRPSNWMRVRVATDSTLMVSIETEIREDTHTTSIPPSILAHMRPPKYPKADPVRWRIVVPPVTETLVYEVYNVLGQRVHSGPILQTASGPDWRSLSLANGLYFYRAKIEGQDSHFGKMWVVK